MELRKARKDAGLSQVDLAREVGVSVSLISMMENGYRPRSENAEAIAKALGVPRESLFPK